MKGALRRLRMGTIAAVTTAIMAGCAAKLPDLPKKRPLAFRVLKKKPVLSSVWEGGHCKFKGNSVSYRSTASGKTNSMELDVKVKGAKALICSSSYTVLLGKDKAFVALGGSDILNGRTYFGSLGNKLTWANSYELDLSDVVKAGGKLSMASLVESKLCIMTNGRTWSLDLSNPYEEPKIY